MWRCGAAATYLFCAPVRAPEEEKNKKWELAKRRAWECVW